MSVRIYLLAGYFMLGSTVALADSSIDAQVKNAFLTLSTFECAVVSPDDKETERLFMLGLKAGRDFIEFARANPEIYRTSLSPKVPFLWNMTSGPTPDFILGQIYAGRVHEVYKEFSRDEELWKVKKQNMYHSKNCALLGK